MWGKRSAKARGDQVDNKAFFKRWSERKEEAKNNAHIKETEKESFSESESPVIMEKQDLQNPLNEINRKDEMGSRQETERASLLTMEDVDKLKEGSSAAAFLVKGVSLEVKKAALSKLFQGADFNVTDGLDDYDLDYSNPVALTAQMREGLRHWTKEHLTNFDGDAKENVELPLDERKRQESEYVISQESTEQIEAVNNERDILSDDLSKNVPHKSLDEKIQRS